MIRERNHDCECGPEAYAHARHRRPNQKQRAEHHGNDSSDAQNAMRGKFRLENEQHKRAGNEQQAREIDGQHMHGVERQQQRDRAEHAGSEQRRDA